MAEGQKAADSVEQKGVEKTPAAAAELGIIGGQRNQEVHDTAHAVSHAYDKTPSELDMVAIRDGETKAQFEARVKSIQENRCVFFDSDEESGSAEETGLVTDYCPVSTGEKSYSLGMDYEEGRDTRSGFEKLADCVRAAGQRAADPKGQQAYIQGQLDKIIGICEGLNIAKEQTKAGSVAGFKALADGTVANFLSKPNAVNDPLFNAVVGALDAMSKNPNAVNHALEHLGIIIMEGSERYTAAPNLEKGHIIGETMFAMVNPEGRMEAGEATLKVANQVAGRVDDAVLKSVQQAFRSAEEMAASFPQQTEKIRERLYDSLKMQFGLTPQELE